MDGVWGLVDTAVTSPWFYLVLFAVAAIDGFFPVVPSESLVITAGVYAASGEPDLVAVVVLAAVGAFTGDHVSFLLGRRAGGRRVQPGGRGGRGRGRLRRGAHDARGVGADAVQDGRGQVAGARASGAHDVQKVGGGVLGVVRGQPAVDL
ncbi:DedA family protein, partial [Actinomadura sp. BRA 177]|uniref:DedA family protein n=1 Tax=Actinomadura sp. BRA 177 TaxID=2745202 RepID=UPI0018039E28|nr:hypothetical protein [Actinomadura sp. BRA 177]